jgi:hypothetical protein
MAAPRAGGGDYEQAPAEVMNVFALPRSSAHALRRTVSGAAIMELQAPSFTTIASVTTEQETAFSVVAATT